MSAKNKEVEQKQLTLWGLIKKLEAVKDKALPLLIDCTNNLPLSLDSWRGSYCDLAIQTEDMGGYLVNTKTLKYQEIGCVNPNVERWLSVLNEAVGETFTGYKGWEFWMSYHTRVWLAEYSNSCFNIVDNIYEEVFFVDVLETESEVILITKIQY